MSNVYALLVGINDYAPEVGRLSGCLNDVERFEDYLRTNFGRAALHIELLKNADATHRNIVTLFRTFLTRAEKDDVVLFYYSGHGAQWAASGAFHKFYPEGKDEGLVCYDSRRPGRYDLADKELAVLISELAVRNPHVAVILDCCHSGSGTRGVDDIVHLKARQTHEVFEERPLESYLDGHYIRLQRAGEPLIIPVGKHILLAACERGQKAWETREHSGVFTGALLDVLHAQGSAISYSDLFMSCRSAVRKRTESQDPQFDTYEQFNANAGFLGRSISNSTRRYRVSYDDGWQLDCGALQGLPTDPQTTVSLSLYPENDSETSVGRAVTVRVGAQKSTLKGDFAEDLETRYRAEICSLPLPSIPVHSIGDAAALEALRTALAKDRSIGIELTGVPSGTRYEILAQNNRLFLLERGPQALIQGAEGYSEYAIGKVFSALKAIAAWERGLALQNYGTQIDTSLVDFWFTEILPDGREHAYGEFDSARAKNRSIASEAGDDSLRKIRRVTIDFVKEGEKWRPIPGVFRARNRSGQTLHMALFYFSPRYGVYRVTNEPLPPNCNAVTLWESGSKQCFYLPEDENEALDRWKLIVSTEKVNDFLLTQEDVKTGEIHPAPNRGIRAVMGFGEPPRDKYEDEWFTKTIEIRVLRLSERVGTEDATLANRKITIKAHPSVSANVSLTSARARSRDAGVGPGIYEALERLPAPPGEPRPFELVNLSASRGTIADPETSVLELTEIQNADALAEHPLEIELDVSLEEDQALLPLSFDGEHLLLGGDCFTDDDGLTHISIDHLPDVLDNRRSLGKSLKLYFFKTYLRRENVNRLRWVEFHDDGSVVRQDQGVDRRVATAKNVLLLVHGIIGDTEGIAKGLRLATDAAGVGIDGAFDLVLSYDYENLATPIEETAADLKRQLEAVGLKQNDNCQLTLLVHSMGGLVSRWFVEQLGGHRVVDHLVMCGTPNNGSPYGDVGRLRKILGVLTTVALNYFPALAPSGSAVLFILNRSKKVTPTLEQMSATSDFMARLNTGRHPPIPYTILAGDLDTVEETSDRPLQRLLTKAGQGFVLESLFKTVHHDIAVRVDSICNVPATSKVDVACHHLSYFASEAGLRALASVAWRGTQRGAR